MKRGLASWKGMRGKRKRNSICLRCQKEFKYYSGSKSGKYCSAKCYWIDHPALIVKGKCLNCGTSMIVSHSGSRARKYCSRQCMSARMRGVNSPLFRGNRKHFRGTDWKEKANECRIRDKQQCQVCGKQWTEGSELLSVDHIVAFRLCLSNELINLISVCRAPCHTAKTNAESKLLRGDVIGFKDRLRVLGWPLERVDAAMNWWNSSPQIPLSFGVPIRDRTMCRSGHKYTEKNTYLAKDGSRGCRECHRLREIKRRARHEVERRPR